MLSRNDIEKAKAKGMLHPFAPGDHRLRTPRALLMCQPVLDAITTGSASDDANLRHRWAQLEGLFEQFVTGGAITQTQVKQLRPPKFGHWEFRSVSPRPSLRVFGRFALPDVFVATHIVERSKLGGMNSPEFEHEKLVCEEHWTAAGFEPILHGPAGVCLHRLYHGKCRPPTGGPAMNRPKNYKYAAARQAERNRYRVWEAVVKAVAQEARQKGLSRKDIAEKIGRNPAQISAWFAGPSNWTLDTVSDLLFAIDAEIDYAVTAIADRQPANSHHLAGQITGTRQALTPMAITSNIGATTYHSTNNNSTTRPASRTLEITFERDSQEVA
jgi:transcriptional regulator with XRE-family HTH domain